jgi:hypothetical protein
VGLPFDRVPTLLRLLAPAALLLVCGLAACATTDGDPRTDPLGRPGDGKTELFWTSLKASYHGPMSAEGDDEVIQAGITMGGEVCDPVMLDASKVCARPEATGDLHEVHCRMQCKSLGSNPGPTLARATLFVGGRPVALQLDRVEMVGKP